MNKRALAGGARIEGAVNQGGEFCLVYGDDHLLVLDKPSGLLTVPGRGDDLKDCLSARVQRQFADALVVHRLDRDTSGLIVMARGLENQRALSRQFELRTVDKRYVAVVNGLVSEERGVVELPLRKDFDHPPRHMVDHQWGRPAQTRWHLLERGVDRTRLAIQPLTGRSHQIRIHLAAMGHPILGDNLYAPDDARNMARRLLLHAAELAIEHPGTGQAMRWSSACPF